jgi:HK97 gp10 family phage protein
MPNTKLRSDLTRIALQAPEAAKAALLATGKDIFDLSQQLVPVDTGKLKKSGGVEVVSSTEVNVGYGIQGSEREDVALYVEYGTSSSPAQPYLTPAFVQNEETFKVRLREEAGKLVT